MTERTLILDGDIMAYKAAASTERPIKWNDDLWTLHASEGEGIAHMEKFIERMMDKLNGSKFVVALSHSENFRKEIYPAYKSNRKDVRKPVTLMPLRQYLRDNYKVYEKPKLEGDDILGILLTDPDILPGERIAVSIDKDQKTVPGLLYMDNKQALIEVTPEKADRWHLVQTLAGDVTDGYPGCPGIGVELANRHLESGEALVPVKKTISRGPRKGTEVTEWVQSGEPAAPWDIVVSLYAKAGLNEAAALTMARVARICRNTDYDFIKKEPILWNPQ